MTHVDPNPCAFRPHADRVYNGISGMDMTAGLKTRLKHGRYGFQVNLLTLIFVSMSVGSNIPN